MDSVPVSEVMPGLYRAVLDAVADLEARDRRVEAAAIRSEATSVYSRAWTENAAQRLRALRSRADRVGDVRDRSRSDAVIEMLRRPVRYLADVERRPA